eukprot:g6988.t1
MAARNAHEAAAGDVAAIISKLQHHIDEEFKSAVAAAASGSVGAAGVAATKVIKGEQLLVALHGCTRQLARLRETLLVQANMPHESCSSNEGRNTAIVEEGHKVQSALLQAQQATDDMYHESLAQLKDSSSEDACQTKVLDTVDTCDRTNALTTDALTAISSALSDLASGSPQQARSGSYGASAGTNGIAGFGSGSTSAGRQGTPGQLQPAKPDSLVTGSVGTFKVTASALPPPPPPPAAAKPGRISKDSGSSGVFSPGIHPTAVGRSCRAQAARLKSGEAPARRAKATSAAWTPTSRTATATEVAMALGLNPVTRAEVDAAAGDNKRTTSRAALLGGGVGGLAVDYAGRTGGIRYGGEESAPFPPKADAPPISRNRKLSPEEHRQNEAASSLSSRFGRRSAAGAVETAAQFTREVGSRGGGDVKLAANRTAAAAATAATTTRTTGVSRKSSRASTPAAATGASAFGRRHDSHDASSRGTGMLASPSSVRNRSNRSTPRVQSGASRASSHTSSAAHAALMARPRVSTRAGAIESTPAAPLFAAAYHGRRNPSHAPDSTAFREGLDENVAYAFLDDAELSTFFNSGSSALSSPRRSLSTNRATRRQGLLDLHSASAGGGERRSGGGLGAAPAAAASAARQMRSQSVGRFSMASRGQSESVTRLLAGQVEATTDGDGGAGGSDADAGASGHPPGMDADEAAARRFAKQEQEAQAREDELLALRLAAREEASAERRAARRRGNTHRRNARRSTIPSDHLGFDNTAVTAAALAALVGREGGGGGGGGAGGAAGGGRGTAGVSDAVRALQFQDIEANDYETLLALDEGGGEGGRCCAGGRGLTEEAVEAVLRPEKAAGARLEESCAICMTDFEADDEISVLPCDHAFHSVCIRKWLLMRNRCPTDMQPVVPESPTK